MRHELPEFREAVDEDGPAVDDFLAHVTGAIRPPGTFAWLYRETPAGPGRSVIAVDRGRIVAHAGALRRTLQVGRALEPCVQSIDAATAADWRRRGLNERLWGLLRTLSAHDQPVFVYGFSNRASAPGVIARQGRVALEPFPLLARALPLVRRSETPGRLVPPADVGAIDSGTENHVGVATYEATLRWRYARPGGRYGAAEVRTGGTLQAWGVFAVRRVRGIPVALWMDTIVPPGPLELQLHEAMVQRAAAMGCRLASALAYPRTPWRRILQRVGFLPVPAWANPEPMTLSVGRWGADCPAMVKEPLGWRLSWADHDVP